VVPLSPYRTDARSPGTGSLRLRVRDNGPGPLSAPDGAGSASWTGQPGGGHGLLGMRERAFSVGGALYTGAAPGGGFLVKALLPAGQDPDRALRAAAGATL
jgi:signal transduction histidine kinase